MFLNGRLHRGAGGFAGEFGHFTVTTNGRLCGCGKRGCLETYCSEAAILEIAAERGRALADMTEVAAAAMGGDEVLRDLMVEVGGHMGMAIANVVNMTNPSAIVLGGYFALVADLVVPVIRRSLEANSMRPMCDGLEVLVSSFGLDAVPVGGVALAMEAFLSNRAQVIDMRPSRSVLGIRHAH